MESNNRAVCYCRYPVTQLLYSTLVGQQQSADTNEDAPIHSVSWIDAARFCNQLSQEAGLPEMYIVAEDGLDACCRTVGRDIVYPQKQNGSMPAGPAQRGHDMAKVSDIAWYRENSAGGAMPVGQKLPNDWGLTTCLAMFGSGALTYMIQMSTAPIGSFAVGDGQTMHALFGDQPQTEPSLVRDR